MSFTHCAKRRALAVAALVAVVTGSVASREAQAAGLYFSDRGVRPVGRAGAFVAGADDLGSLWYNPAGLAFAGNDVLVDASWLHFTSTYQRRSVVVNPDTGQETVIGENYFPEVKGTSPVLPLPTIAVSNNFGQEKWNFAAGVMAPYSALTSYPEGPVAFGNGTVPPPQRYSLITLDGSALAIIGAWASYKFSDQFALGGGVQLLTGTFASRLAFSACPPENFICAQEDPNYDAYSQLTVGPIFAPSANLGFTWIASDGPGAQVRIGGSAQAPFWVNAPAKVDIRLPSADIFQNASVDGNQAKVAFTLPAIARIGIETRLGEKKNTRMELSLFYEAWSMHDRITITPAGDGIKLRNVTGFPPEYTVGELAQARGFRDTFSVHGGIEHFFEAGSYPMAIRGGASYERSAIPPSYLSVLTVDVDKVQVALGGSIYVGEKRNLRLDAVIGHTFGFTTDVDPHEAAISKVKVVRANDPPDPRVTKINGGTYSAAADVIGIGLSWKY